jgi:hypothetical protein
MKTTAEQGEVILEVLAEGGGYKIFGERRQGQWRFWRYLGDGDSWMLDEFDEESAIARLPVEPAPEPPITYYKTLDEALKTLNSCWPILFPVIVHSSVANHILKKVEAYVTKYPSQDKRGYLNKWKVLCTPK